MGGAAVADAKAALKERGRGLAELEDEADCVVEEGIVSLVFVGAAGVISLFIFGAFKEALDVLGFALGAPEFCDCGDFFFSDKGCVDALETAGAGGKEEHVAAPEEGFGTVAVDDGAGVDLGGEAEGHAGGDVGFDEAGDDVDGGALGGEDEMDADGAGHLCETGDGLFDVGAVEHHEIGELVDDDHDVGEGFLVDVFEEVLAAVIEELVELVDVADVVGCEQLEAAFHLADGVAQGISCKFGFGDDGRKEVWNALVHAEFDAFGIDEDHADLFGCGLEEDAHDHCVDGNTLTGTCGAGDEDVRHGGEIAGDDASGDVFSQRNGEA